MEGIAVMDSRVDRPATIDILLVGGRPVIRERLRKLLDDEPGFRVTGNVSNAAQALKAIPDVKPDIVIISLSGAPLARTMRALQKLAAPGDRPRTILIATAIERTNVAQAKELGVSRILPKSAPPSVLIDSVRSVAGGASGIRRDPFADFPGQKRHLRPIQKNPFGLTKREMEVVEAVVRTFLISLN